MLELLRELLHRKPFRPVNVVTKSGERYEIRNNERVAIGKTQVYIVLPSDRVVPVSENEIELVYEPRSVRSSGRDD